METTEQQTALILTKHKVSDSRFESNNGGKIFAPNVERLSREQGNRSTSFNWYHQNDNI